MLPVAQHHVVADGLHLAAEVGLFQAVAIHDFHQVFKHTVEHLMELFPNHGQWLLGWQCSGVELHL